MAIQRIRLAWEELNDNSYQGGKDFIKQIGQQAKGVACSLYRSTPGALVPNPAGNFLSGMWDSICSDDPGGLPPSPQSPFEGGQCNVDYEVNFTSRARNITNCSLFLNQTTTRTLRGAIGKPYFEPTGATANSPCNGGVSNLQLGDWLIPYRGGASLFLASQNAYSDGSSDYFSSVVINSVARSDGQPDDCGKPPPEFPPPPPDYQPPSGDIVINPRPDDPDFSITIPFIWVDADFNLDIRPTIDLGGVTITFDFGGITIEYNPDTAPLPLPDYNPNPDFTLPPAPDIEIPDFPDIPDYSPDFGDIKDDLTDIKDKLDEEDPPPEPDLIDIEVPIGNCNFETFEYTETSQTIEVDARQASVVYGQYRAAADRVREDCKPSDEPGESISAIPEWWQTVLTGEVPQLVQVSRREGTRTYYQLAIPHPLDTTPRDTPLIPTYRAGDYMGMITLRDNSKFICYCFDEAEANRVLDAATAIIDSSWQFSPQRRRIAKTNGYGIAQDLRKPTKNVYFAQGNRLLRPTWSRKVRNASDID